MDKAITILAICVTSVSSAEEVTFESVQNEFREKALSLLTDNRVSNEGFNAKIVTFADETFGAHPDVMRIETEKRLMSLPRFPSSLMEYVERKTWNLRSLPPIPNGQVWLLYGCDPEKLAGWLMKLKLSRHLTPDEYGRRELLKNIYPDKVYRLGEGNSLDLVVESLGDLFVIRVEITEAGFCKPLSVKWTKKVQAIKNTNRK